MDTRRRPDPRGRGAGPVGAGGHAARRPRRRRGWARRPGRPRRRRRTRQHSRIPGTRSGSRRGRCQEGRAALQAELRHLSRRQRPRRAGAPIWCARSSSCTTKRAKRSARVIKNGRPQAGMPGFPTLSPDDVYNIAQYPPPPGGTRSQPRHLRRHLRRAALPGQRRRQEGRRVLQCRLHELPLGDRRPRQDRLQVPAGHHPAIALPLARQLATGQGHGHARLRPRPSPAPSRRSPISKSPSTTPPATTITGRATR